MLSGEHKSFSFAFLDHLCKKNYIEIRYTLSGHSMMPVDRDFSSIEKARHKLEKVSNPEEYVELIKSCWRRNCRRGPGGNF